VGRVHGKHRRILSYESIVRTSPEPGALPLRVGSYGHSATRQVRGLT
jgi:hypothetical protein